MPDSESTERPRRVGVLGGTFDPIHVGHLVTAVNVRHALGLDGVILMVANVPWQKEGQRSITPAPDRLAETFDEFSAMAPVVTILQLGDSLSLPDGTGGTDAR